jgi:hypothetical protein
MSQPVLASGQWPPATPSPLSFGPLLLAVLPSNGPVAGGGIVQLLGLGLGGATSVLFGTTPATILAGDMLGITITVAVPAHSAATVPVTVVTPSGTSNAVPYTYTTPVPTGPPTATGINPTSGPVAGNTPFVITGSSLTAATVTVGTTAAIVLGTDPTGTLLFGLIPPGTATGNVPVTATTPAGTATVPGGYTYL